MKVFFPLVLLLDEQKQKNNISTFCLSLKFGEIINSLRRDPSMLCSNTATITQDKLSKENEISFFQYLVVGITVCEHFLLENHNYSV